MVRLTIIHPPHEPELPLKNVAVTLDMFWKKKLTLLATMSNDEIRMVGKIGDIRGTGEMHRPTSSRYSN